MASSAATPTLAHRTVSTIRSGTSHSPSPTGQPGLGNPQTPARASSTSAFNSPSTLRADEETLVIELGSRIIRVGLAGEPTPKATLRPGPENQRRAGDITSWLPQKCDKSPATWPPGDEWSAPGELWRSDRPCSDMGLVSDKLERILRDAFAHHLLIDSRPRRISLVLPPAAPLPSLSAVLDTLFGRFQSPTVSLVSSPVMAAVGAGVRSALVVDIGWAETVVSSVYEYREIRHSRTIRAGRMLVQHVHDMLAGHLRPDTTGQGEGEPVEHLLSFDECEDITSRFAWSRQMASTLDTHSQEGLAPVPEQDESTTKHDEGTQDSPAVPIFLTSCAGAPRSLDIPLRQLSDPCEKTFVNGQYSEASFDDQEMPLPELIYKHLLSLPIDARASCMSRILFTGGGAKIPGLRLRVFDEVCQIIRNRGWDPVLGKGADKVRYRERKRRNHGVVPSDALGASAAYEHDIPSEPGLTGRRESATATESVNRMPNREAQDDGGVHGKPRAIESLGPWTGASLAMHLKTVAVANIDREIWLQQGVHGASRASDVDMKAQQRQGLGLGLLRGAPSSVPWTLGAWGVS